jgi:hypothetical protein
MNLWPEERVNPKNERENLGVSTKLAPRKEYQSRIEKRRLGFHENILSSPK